MAAGLEVSPARMEGNEGWIGKRSAWDAKGRLHGSFEPIGIESKPGRSAVLDIFQHRLRPLADRRGRAQVRKGIVHAERGPPGPLMTMRTWRSALRLFIEAPPLGLGELGRLGLALREVSGGLLGIHLDLRVGGDELVGDRHLLANLDAP